MDAPCHPPCHDRKTGAVPAVGDLSNRGRSADRGAFHQHRLRPGWEWRGLVWGSEAERPIRALSPALDGGKERVGHSPGLTLLQMLTAAGLEGWEPRFGLWERSEIPLSRAAS